MTNMLINQNEKQLILDALAVLSPDSLAQLNAVTALIDKIAGLDCTPCPVCGDQRTLSAACTLHE